MFSISETKLFPTSRVVSRSYATQLEKMVVEKVPVIGQN